ncbi:hypothetical protein M8818_007346 [Zalaria obscura]|uniref:Uncharacterized protein n=1 Tax=Zalaria obscura TaxID=2024903 RepID=A0ACC3S319_9PEZI
MMSYYYKPIWTYRNRPPPVVSRASKCQIATRKARDVGQKPSPESKKPRLVPIRSHTAISVILSLKYPPDRRSLTFYSSSLRAFLPITSPMPSRKNVAGLLALGAAATVGAHPLQARATTSNAATYNGCMYNVDGNYNFTDSLSVDFTTISAVPSTLTASTQAIGGSPAGHQFTPDNIAFVGDSVALTVPGGQSGTCQNRGEN